MTGLTWYQCLRCGRREEGGGYRCQCGARREVIPDPEGERLFSLTPPDVEELEVLAGVEARFRRYGKGDRAFALPPEYVAAYLAAYASAHKRLWAGVFKNFADVKATVNASKKKGQPAA